WPILTCGYKNIQRAIYFDSLVIEDPWHLDIERDLLPRNDTCMYAQRVPKSTSWAPSSVTLNTQKVFTATVRQLFKTITLNSSRQCKHIYSAQLIKICREAIPNCITHNSSCSQLHGPTTLEKKVEILF
ncbi:hypothetical protein TSAR_010750, partial [Trichomalopsis sarcophagae]